jgi:hypothetical protein
MISRWFLMAAVFSPVFSTLNGPSADEPMASAADLVTYRVTFASTWSVDTHPQDFPSNPHFSGLIGATHNAAGSFWNAGQLASAGVESMAETGGKSALIAEVNGAIGAGHAEFLLSGNGIGRSPGQVELEFQVTDSYPLVTLVSMLAPSPDWFVGVSGVDLYEGGAWVQRLEVPLVVYDAGTDSGPSYTSANDDTDPADAISELTEAPFDGEQQVGTFVFELQSGVGVEADAALPDAFGSVAIYPNPSVDLVFVQIVPMVPGAVVVEVFDVLGRMVHRVSGSDGVAGVETQLGVDVQDWPDGLYVVRIGSGERSEARAFVVSRGL